MNYIRIAFAAGILIIILGLAAAMYYYRGDAIAARAETAQTRATLARAIEVNADNEKAITALQNARARESQLAADLAEQVKASNQALLDATTERRNLENGDEDVRKFLALRIPDALRLRDVSAEGTAGHR
ncbi:hypothetical protein [Mesorhizobium sp.]|uniref:hypothetical protein n=1 Tax=Mesorhizobium sp. TaxID=1871066 RepID=UPI000FE5E9B5|nr:hypothetical protein [Mesorhizobium sp.]RWB66592.1 MAG: hypothetical protein EOQ49_28280 [Mesorhizobium sp.]